jgi:23S rRNA (pseudouridine1915-N3)-methyltransferase
MKLKLVFVGKTENKCFEEQVIEYEKRILRYLPFSVAIVAAGKNQKTSLEEEFANVIKVVTPGDIVYLFDERGKEFDSVTFSKFIEKSLHESGKSIVFVIGGAYGFSKKMYERANGLISLSKLTFTHQMVRLIAIEQIYRACSIIRNEPYHHN